MVTQRHIPDKGWPGLGRVVFEPFRDAIAPCEVTLLAVSDGITNNENLGVRAELSGIWNWRGSPWFDGRSSCRLGIAARKVTFNTLLVTNGVSPAILLAPNLVEIAVLSSVVHVAVREILVGMDTELWSETVTLFVWTLRNDGSFSSLPDPIFQLRVVASTADDVEASGAELINWSIISIIKPSRADQGGIATRHRVLTRN